MNDDTIGQILAFLGFVWFLGIIIVAIGSSLVFISSVATSQTTLSDSTQWRYYVEAAEAPTGSYCFLHDSSSKHTYSSDSSNTTSSETSSDSSYTGSSAGSTSSSASAKTYSSSEGSSDYEDACSAYSDGYDDIDMQQDYDEDRYEKDSDYAEGVDDAMDDAYYQYGEEY